MPKIGNLQSYRFIRSPDPARLSDHSLGFLLNTEGLWLFSLTFLTKITQSIIFFNLKHLTMPRERQGIYWHGKIIKSTPTSSQVQVWWIFGFLNRSFKIYTYWTSLKKHLLNKIDSNRWSVPGWYFWMKKNKGRQSRTERMEKEKRYFLAFLRQMIHTDEVYSSSILQFPTGSEWLKICPLRLVWIRNILTTCRPSFSIVLWILFNLFCTRNGQTSPPI